MKTSDAIVGIAVAAAAGIAIGMLIAPEKGTDLQKRIREGAQGWLDDISKMIQSEKRMLTEGKNEAEKVIHELRSN